MSGAHRADRREYGDELTTYIFWNVGRQDLGAVTAQLADDMGADVVVLAETQDDGAIELPRLKEVDSTYAVSDQLALGRGLSLFYKASKVQVDRVHDSKFWSISEVRPNIGASVLLTCVHMPCKSSIGYGRSESRFDLFVWLRQDVEQAELTTGCSRSAIVGDLNQNPFDVELVNLASLNSVMDPAIAQRGSCTRYGQEYRYFYNPTWKECGTDLGGTFGTYYYQEPEIVRYYWQTFDQVLVRPEVISALSPISPQVIKAIGQHNLVKANGRPDEKNYSDHLPITFKIDHSRLEATDE